MTRLRTSALLPFFAIVSITPVGAEEPAQARVVAIKAAYAQALEAQSPDRLSLFRNVRDSLEHLIDDHPSSDAAVDILLRRKLAGLDLEAMDTALIDALGDRPAQVQAPAFDGDAAGQADPEQTALPPTVLGTAPLNAKEPEYATQAAPTPQTTPPDGVSGDKPTVANATRDGSAKTEQNIDDREVAALAPTADAEAMSEAPQQRLAPASEDGELQLGLSRRDVREIQARLTAIGVDPRGIDGIIGPGTRNALRQWQQEAGLAGTGYLDAPHLDRLRELSQSAYDTWRSDPGNRARVEVVAITPARMSGTWRFSARCGSDSRFPGQTFAGTMTMEHVGSGTYRGTARNSQGLRGQVSTRITGRNVESVINWGFLVGKVRSQGRISDDARSFSGRDSHGCRVAASKT